MAARAPLGAILAFVGAVAALRGSFLPWAHVTVIRSPLTGSSITLDPSGWNGDGNVVFGLGVAAAIVGGVLLMMDATRAGPYLRNAMLLFGIAVVVVTFWDTTHVSQRFSHVASRVSEERRSSPGHLAPRVRTRVAPGIFIAAGGGALMVFAALIDRFLVDQDVIVVED